jgi:uncharacterized membrane protein YebE (DUF533 family)
MFVPNATLARIVRGVAAEPSPQHAAKIRALSATGLVGTAAYGYYARRAAQPAVSALAEDTTSALVRLKFSEAETLIRVMIAAAACDGDETRIRRHLRDAGATSAELAYAQAEARRPATPEELAESITDQETAMEVYAAALLASEGSTPQARQFLARLAHALDLPFHFLSELHASWGDSAPKLDERMAHTAEPR